MIDAIYGFGQGLLAAGWWGDLAWPLIWNLIKITLVLMVVLGAVTYTTLWERRVLGWVQVRMGPNRVGPLGLLQPIADALKLMTKEIVRPAAAEKMLFYMGPVLTVMPALAAWAVVPFGPEFALANINAGLLFLMAITSMEVYGVIISGWSSNSKYAFLGALRASAQMVSYEIAMGFCFLIVLMVSASLNLSDIVAVQGRGQFAQMGLNFLSWNWLPLLPMFLVYLISGVAETNRAPFDVAEGESEIVAGFHVEYSGMAFALFFLAEYANMILVSALTSILFLGGWLSPLGFLPDGMFWLFVKMSAVLFLFLWFRATFPRYRFDQLMRLGWKVFLPICLVWLVVVGAWMMSPLNIWK